MAKDNLWSDDAYGEDFRKLPWIKRTGIKLLSIAQYALFVLGTALEICIRLLSQSRS